MSSIRLPIHSVLPLVAALGLLTGACGVPVAVTAASYAADGGLMLASDKTSTDHLLSVVTEQDCAMWRILRGRQICVERADGKDPYNTDYSEPQRQVSEDGTQYAPPLKPAADAPAASWDAAAYRTAPAPTPGPDGPMTASVEPTVETPPTPAAATPATPAKPRKARSAARPAKKPSRGPAATAP
jgi:hypothetical protein